MQDTGRDKRITVAEASERLGVTKEAVRKRISRGTLRADKDPDGAVRVYVPASDTPSGTAVASELVEELRDQVRYLRDQLDQERGANRENRRIIAALTSRIPELPAGTPQAASSEPRESPEMADDVQQGRGPAPDTGGPREGAELPWWRRMFGG
ncbi:MAG TPA: hypothetical protein VFE09_00810 [Rubrobacteraceae bacterium]|nr:hypothetical protein [Rubrobacteraceae bacterium]